ncbi:DUF397 domain-containing protein [Streptomyces sp. NPDC087538]|uniref:DUF397 domain-containing protein n=1 Tax=Streptomyces sp. NPDC087538 TaxID=3365797 RepID=UPI0037F9F48A
MHRRLRSAGFSGGPMLPSTGWHKSSYSGDCLEACVEASRHPDGEGVLIRDSKDATRRPLAFSAGAWRPFLASPCPPLP